MLKTSLIIEDINIIEDKEMINKISKLNSDAKIKISLNICEITEMFKYYVNRHIEDIGDINDYDCFDPETYNDENLETRFKLNDTSDDEDLSDIKAIKRELKKHFGITLTNCRVSEVLRILLIGSNYYNIECNILNIIFELENLENHWLKEYINK